MKDTDDCEYDEMYPDYVNETHKAWKNEGNFSVDLDVATRKRMETFLNSSNKDDDKVEF